MGRFCSIPNLVVTMGSGQNLSREKRAQTVALQESGLSQRQIAVQLGCSRGAVRNAIKRYRETGGYKDRLGRGRPFLSTRRENRILVRAARQDRRKTSLELQAYWRNHYGIHASRRTIRRR